MANQQEETTQSLSPKHIDNTPVLNICLNTGTLPLSFLEEIK